MRGERGIGLIGVMGWMAVVGLIAWAAIRIVPLYFEFWGIRDIFAEQVQKGKIYGSARELEAQILKELRFQDLDRLDARAIKVQWLPDPGHFRVSARYEAVVRLTDGVRLVFTFRPEAAGSG